MKPMKLKLQDPSLARAPFKALGGPLYKYLLSYLILYSFSHTLGPKKLYESLGSIVRKLCVGKSLLEGEVTRKHMNGVSSQ